jgi:hypothetical protein
MEMRTHNFSNDLIHMIDAGLGRSALQSDQPPDLIYQSDSDCDSDVELDAGRDFFIQVNTWLTTVGR